MKKSKKVVIPEQPSLQERLEAKKPERTEPQHFTPDAWKWLVSPAFAPLKKKGSKIEPKAYPPICYPGPETLIRISMAKRELGWKPEIELDEGLARTIHYFASLG